MGEMQVKQEHNEITDLLSKMITMGGFVGHNEEKLLHYTNEPEKPIVMEMPDNSTRNLYLYSLTVKDPNAVLINPIGDGVAIGKEKLWFYKQLNATCSVFLKNIMTDILKLASSKDEQEDIHPSLVPILGKVSTQIDNKTLKEFDLIVKTSPNELFKIYYSKKDKTSRAMTCFQYKDTSFQNSFKASDVRKKSWQFFYDFINMIFNCDTTLSEQYSYTSDHIGYVQFETYSHVWVKVWKALLPYTEYLGIFIGDSLDNVQQVEKYLQNLAVYHQKSSWTGQSTCMKRLQVPESTVNARDTVPWDDKNRSVAPEKHNNGVSNTLDCLGIREDYSYRSATSYGRYDERGYRNSVIISNDRYGSGDGYVPVTELVSRRSYGRYSSSDRRRW